MTSQDTATLRAYVRSNPDDWDARRVYADALDEAGEVVLANGQRWQARERKRPQVNSVHSEGHYWCAWWCLAKEESHDDLAPAIWNKLDVERSKWLRYVKIYPTVDAAEDALAVALWSLKIVVEGRLT